MTERAQSWIWFVSLTALGISVLVAFFDMTEARSINQKLDRLETSVWKLEATTILPGSSAIKWMDEFIALDGTRYLMVHSSDSLHRIDSKELK